MTKYFIFDCETGGLPEQDASILTMHGKLLHENFKVLDTIDINFKPNNGVYKVHPRALIVNKIDLIEHDKTAVKFSEARKIFENFIQKNNVGDHKIIPIGHCVHFDIEFMKTLVGAHNWSRMFSKKVIDTASIAEFLCTTGILPLSSTMDCSLSGLAAHFGLDVNGLHNAKFDVELTLAVLKEFQKLIKQ